ncbi:hypothetical protein [[Pseudomonas] boreopolis]|uniref:hypothetical protein n=1 Tax=Xanthomonas boreopolis TaxID=86183 RepID=UPI003D9B62CE
MGLRAWLGLKPRRDEALESAFDPIEIPAEPRIPQGFREFTLPPRLQRSGRRVRGNKRDSSSFRIPIVLDVGVKVP